MFLPPRESRVLLTLQTLFNKVTPLWLTEAESGFLVPPLLCDLIMETHFTSSATAQCCRVVL